MSVLTGRILKQLEKQRQIEVRKAKKAIQSEFFHNGGSFLGSALSIELFAQKTFTSFY